ncbi:hypothetical protein Csa_024011 [Cucumis sativus]|nr:hypothetical protein Csa_024011 [Cucumis sativus]
MPSRQRVRCSITTPRIEQINRSTLEVSYQLQNAQDMLLVSVRSLSISVKEAIASFEYNLISRGLRHQILTLENSDPNLEATTWLQCSTQQLWFLYLSIILF